MAIEWAKDPYLIRPGHDAAKARALAIWRVNPQDIGHFLKDPSQLAQSVIRRMPRLAVRTLILNCDHDIADVQAMASVARVLIGSVHGSGGNSLSKAGCAALM